VNLSQSTAFMKLTVRPLTPSRWHALEHLFGNLGACNGCWCMYWRIGAAYRTNSRAKNRAAFRRAVKQGPTPGLLAFDGDLAVGWCQLTPREALPWLDKTWRGVASGDESVWSLSCLYVRKGYRRKGVTMTLIQAAIKAAQYARASALEAYPLDADQTPSASGTGYRSTFARAGFRVVAHRTPARPIMRHYLNAEGRHPD
jgi:GNAT superfamily N-acetyltransferase